MGRRILGSHQLPVMLLLLATAFLGTVPARADGPGAATPNLGVHEHESGDVDVVLLKVSRTSGDTLTVRWKYVNHSSDKKRLTSVRTGWLDPYRLAADAYVLDTENQTKYTVLLDADKQPVAGTHGGQNSYIWLEPDATLTTWAKFPAPPVGVGKVTVAIPGTEPFEDVPISQ